jgi:hypothetical protein
MASSIWNYASLMILVIACYIFILKLDTMLPAITLVNGLSRFVNPNVTTTTSTSLSRSIHQEVPKDPRGREDTVNSSDSTTLLLPRNETPAPGWIYEPPSVNFFWRKMADRPFIGTIYPKLKSFSNVLDIGARGYNRNCKAMINSATTKYYQVEPFPPKELHNDGLLTCKLHEIPILYPQYNLYFDVVLDIGVLGAGLLTTTNITESNENYDGYMTGLLYVLKPKGLWILKTNDGWVPDHEDMIQNVFGRHFTLGKLEEWESGIRPTRKRGIRFYFLYRKEIS